MHVVSFISGVKKLIKNNDCQVLSDIYFDDQQWLPGLELIPDKQWWPGLELFPKNNGC